MNIEEHPAIRHLEEGVAHMSPKDKQFVYDIVRRFHSIGVGQAAVVGAMSALKESVSSIGTDEEYQAYLALKAHEVANSEQKP